MQLENGINSLIPSNKMEAQITLQKRNAGDVINTIQPSMSCQDQRDKQTQAVKPYDTEENDWRVKVYLLDY